MKRHNVALRHKDLNRLQRFGGLPGTKSYDALIARACLNLIAGNVIIHGVPEHAAAPGRQRGTQDSVRRGSGRRSRPGAWGQVFLKEGYEALNIIREIIAARTGGKTLSIAGVLHVVSKARFRNPGEWSGEYPTWLWDLYVKDHKLVDILLEKEIV